MFENLLQQEVPVVGILFGAAALFLFRKAAVSMKQANSRPLIGSMMLLMGLVGFGMSSTEMSIEPSAKQHPQAVMTSYEETVDAFATSQPESTEQRYVPNQVAGGVLALSVGLAVCGITTVLRGWVKEGKSNV